jgi:PTH1 family peptidyl-tRNA hydrolase
MNYSGIVARQLSALPSFSLNQFLVVLDDFSLRLGGIRMRRGGSSGGHRGLESIIYTLGSDSFPRLRVGIGPVADNAVDFVLSRFTNEEMGIVRESIQKGIAAAEIFIMEGIEKAMNFAN